MTDDHYLAVMEESLARHEMCLSRLWLLYDRAAERRRPAIAERILDAEATLNLAETMLHDAHTGRRTAGSGDHRRPMVTVRPGAAAWLEQEPGRRSRRGQALGRNTKLTASDFGASSIVSADAGHAPVMRRPPPGA